MVNEYYFLQQLMYFYPPVTYPICPEMLVQRKESAQEVQKKESILQVSSMLDYHKSDAEIERLEAQVHELMEELEENKKISFNEPVKVNLSADNGSVLRKGMLIIMVLIVSVLASFVMTTVI